MNKFEEYLSMAKISDFIHRIAGIAAIAAIAFGIYKYLSREDDVDDFEDDFEDDFDDDFEDEEDDFVKEDEAAPAKDEE